MTHKRKDPTTLPQGYTLRKLTVPEADALCRGVSYSGYRRYWAVVDPEGEYLRDGGPLSCLVGCDTKKDAVAEYWRYTATRKRNREYARREAAKAKAQADREARMEPHNVDATAEVRFDMPPDELAAFLQELDGAEFPLYLEKARIVITLSLP